jgi:uncharacterized membrane protein
MKYNEAAVFKWVVIVGIAIASAVVLTLLTSSLVGALWGLVLAIAACVYCYRWTRDWWRRAGERQDAKNRNI